MWPPVVRHLLLPAHEALLRRPTISIARRLGRDDGCGERMVAEYQTERMAELVRHALSATPYWQARARREGRAPTADDFPLLTRADIARDRQAMCWPEAPGRLILDTSSGTTGDSLVFYVDRERQAWDRALRLHALARLGIEPGERQAHVWPEYRGGTLGAFKATLRAARDRLTNDPVCDLRPMTHESLDAALAFLERWRPVVVIGYPSWLHALARRRLTNPRGTSGGRRPWTPRRVVTTAELLYDFQRRTIESAFGAPVSEEYGSQGVGLIASEDAAGRWQVHWQHALVELRTGGRATRPGEHGEVIVTNLHSHAMPFIRFATGDVARAPLNASADGADGADGAPGRFGRRAMPRIAGRTSDLPVDADGRLRDNRELVEAVVRETGVTEFALHQPAFGRLVCLTLQGSEASARQAAVTGLLRSMLGRSMQVDWRVGRAFRMPSSGKRRYVCSPVAQALLAHDRESGRAQSEHWPERVLVPA